MNASEKRGYFKQKSLPSPLPFFSVFALQNAPSASAISQFRPRFALLSQQPIGVGYRLVVAVVAVLVASLRRRFFSPSQKGNFCFSREKNHGPAAPAPDRKSTEPSADVGVNMIRALKLTHIVLVISNIVSKALMLTRMEILFAHHPSSVCLSACIYNIIYIN